MTRPMPGPPEGWWYCTPPHGEPGLCTFDMDPAEYMPLAALDAKRLTDAECVDHWDAAEQEASYALLRRALGDKRVTEQDVEQSSHIAATWPRFTIRPHAFDAT